MEKRQLSLKERWEIDNKMFKEGASFRTSTPICERCKWFIRGDIFQCMKYTEEEKKPRYVIIPSKECERFSAIDPLNIEDADNEKSRLLGGMFGFAVGDALGVPVEFSTREERDKDTVREMRAYGTYHQPYGTWSDDTSLTLCLMENLIEGYGLQDLANKFIAYYREGYLTPYGKMFDIGNATRNAIERMMTGENPVECGGSTEYDNGNGSLMRILPLAYYLKGINLRERIQIVEDVSALTHGHKRSKLACIMYVEMAINLINGMDKVAAYEKMLEVVKVHCIDEYKDEFMHYEMILSGQIVDCNRKGIKSSGYVVDTLEAVIWSFLKEESYENTVFNAINLGEDTDTIGALAGGLAGIYYGIKDIRTNWIDCLAQKEKIYEMVELFTKQFN